MAFKFNPFTANFDIDTTLNLSVSDTSEIDLTLASDVLSATIIAGSIDETKLDTSVNASLDLADSAIQNLAGLGITATASELNILDGATLTTAELNFVDGVTSNIQTQLNSKLATATATSTYVPYTGATANVDLGANSFTIGRTIPAPTEFTFADAGVGLGEYSPVDGLLAVGYTTVSNAWHTGGALEAGYAAYVMITPDSEYDEAYGASGNLYTVGSLNTDYYYFGLYKTYYSYYFDEFVPEYRILITEFNAGNDSWEQLTANALPTVTYTQNPDYDLYVNSTQVRMNKLQVGRTVTKTGIIETDVLKTVEFEGIDESFYFNPDPFPSDAGSRFVWDKTKASLLAGSVDGTQWNSANVGDYTATFGRNNQNSGDNGLVVGFGNTASGVGSVTTGQGVTNSGAFSFVTGSGNDVVSSGTSFVSASTASTVGGNRILAAVSSSTLGGAQGVFTGSGHNINSISDGAVIGRNLTSTGIPQRLFMIGRNFSASVDDTFAVGFDKINLQVQSDKVSLPQDTTKLFFGAGDDASISYNGTDMLINAQEVGTGHVILNTPKTTTGDPTGVEGKIYWNTVDNVIKMYADGAWRTLASW